jgi:hypothetical protein
LKTIRAVDHRLSSQFDRRQATEEQEENQEARMKKHLAVSLEETHVLMSLPSMT